MLWLLTSKGYQMLHKDSLETPYSNSDELKNSDEHSNTFEERFWQQFGVLDSSKTLPKHSYL